MRRPSPAPFLRPVAASLRGQGQHGQFSDGPRGPEAFTQANSHRQGKDQTPEARLRILATSDLHANVLSYDYSANRPLFGQGLAPMSTLIAAARSDHPSTLLLDNGDFLQGSALADMAALPRRRRGHPVIAAMNALGYDAAALGNHEFNFGLGLLRRAVAQARFPILSANVLTRRGARVPEDKTLVPPFALLDRWLTDQTGQRHPVRIGVLGLTPPEVLRWDRAHLAGKVETRPMVETAESWVPHLRRLGADVVVCLAHTGIALGPAGTEGEGQAAELAGIAGLDALVAGHSHMVFPHRGPHPDPRIQPEEGMISGKPVVQPGHNGSHLGVLDLTLRRIADRWTVIRSTVRAENVSEVVAGLPAEVIRRNAEPLRRAVQSDHRAALDWTRRPLGTSALAMSSCFAQVADVPAMRLLAAAKVVHVRRVLQGTPEAEWPVLGLATPYRAGGHGGALNYSRLPEGALTVRHLFDLYPFPNVIVAHRTTGADLAELLERAAAQFLQVRPGGADQLLIDPAFPGFAFATVTGLSYRIDLSRPARYDSRGSLARPECSRIRDLALDGRPVQPGDRFVLASNNYRTGGTLGLVPPAPRDILVEDGTLCTDALRRFIESAGTITPELLDMHRGPGWGLAPMPGASVIFDTGAAAEDHLSDVAALRPEFLGLTPGGFRRYRLHL
jgi:2',3'-cyclic-nucleotide 2'-phosphodiesterase/3'-nucleotidase